MAVNVPIIKAKEKTAQGRIYTPESIKLALDKVKWDSVIPLISTDRDGNKKEIAFFKKPDFKFNEGEETLFVILNDDIRDRVFGRTLVPYIYINSVRRLDKKAVEILDFTFNGVQATSDLGSFPSIDSTVKK